MNRREQTILRALSQAAGPPILDGETVTLTQHRLQHLDMNGNPFQFPGIDPDQEDGLRASPYSDPAFEMVDAIRRNDPDAFLRTYLTDNTYDLVVHTSYLTGNEQFFPGELPLIWESMVELSTTNWQHRYTTKAAAHAGHAALVEALENAGLRVIRREKGSIMNPEVLT